jgi:predicted AlkP superfamily phosphohydrolase/phosphomutase
MRSPGSRLELTRRERFDLVTFYTWWPDAFNHAMSVADYDEIAAGRSSSGCPAAFLSAYEKLDAFVAALRAAIPDADLILLSDHGVRVAWRGYRFPLGEVTILSPRRIERTAFRVERVLQHVYGCPGVVLADGPDVQRGHGRVSFRDVTPTLLAYFGLPLADDMAGRPVPGLLQATSSSGRVRSYDGLVPNDRVEGEGREMEGVRERLRALGYLQ